MIKTDYDAFVFVRNKLLKQNAKSQNEDNTCLYRGWLPETLSKMNERATEKLGDFDYGSDDSPFYEYFRDIQACTPSDAKCAAGWLISDDYYSNQFEERSVDDSEVMTAIEYSNPEWKIDGSGHTLLVRMQQIHDSKNISEWEMCFDDLENHFDENGNFTDTY